MEIAGSCIPITDDKRSLSKKSIQKILLSSMTLQIFYKKNVGLCNGNFKNIKLNFKIINWQDRERGKSNALISI